jgi:structural maintenance of chromosome 4
MELENFKSYAGVQPIGPFHKCFSSVVGPNGSGKSNVIDALLFVFGKRAKQLRLNKVSELIHKSAEFPNLEYARVSVYFQLIYDIEESEDDFEVVPNSQFTITRIAESNNSSKYLVNNKTSSYGEIGQLLRSYGIDLDNNRFLILQGEVEQIAMMKPKGASPHEEGLLEYLEDIIGSNVFLEKIEDVSACPFSSFPPLDKFMLGQQTPRSDQRAARRESAAPEDRREGARQPH